MEARGLGASTLGQVEEIEAKIQARVADFLASKKKIRDIMNQTLDLNVRGEAEALLVAQGELEIQLAEVLQIIDRVKAGSYSVSDIIKAGAFYYSMETHLSDVDGLQNTFLGAPKQAGFTGFELLIMGLIVGGVLYGITKRRG